MRTVVNDRNGLFRPKVGKTAQEHADKRDPYNRGAKHKALDGYEDDYDDLDEGFQIGDRAIYGETDDDEGEECLIKNPNGPLDLVGISVGGKYTLVPEDKLKLISEAITRMNELSK